MPNKRLQPTLGSPRAAEGIRYGPLMKKMTFIALSVASSYALANASIYEVHIAFKEPRNCITLDELEASSTKGQDSSLDNFTDMVVKLRGNVGYVQSRESRVVSTHNIQVNLYITRVLRIDAKSHNKSLQPTSGRDAASSAELIVRPEREPMNNLADIVLDYYWFLNFCSDDELDPDTAVKEMESLAHAIETSFTDAEKSALQEAAKRSLAQWLREPDDHGYTPRKLLTAEKREFLESIAAGRFSGPTLEEHEA